MGTTTSSWAISRAELRQYYLLVKPGIIYGNLLAAAGGFLFAGLGAISWLQLLALLTGTALVIGAGCVFNNIIDMPIDAKMERTKARPLITGAIDPAAAKVFGAVLATAGFAVLAAGTNLLTVYVGLFGLFAYVVLYSIGKRATVHGTLIGSLSGATPPLAGYVAATGRLDVAAVLLFLALVFWQMPHFYAIAVFRRRDYEAANIPVLPLAQSITAAKRQIVGYIVLFALTVSLLGVVAGSSQVYLLVMLAVILRWLQVAWRGFTTQDATAWARRVFGQSLVVLLVFCTANALITIMP